MEDNTSGSVKCQYITLDDHGNVTESCDTLFEMNTFSGSGTRKKFPFLNNILRKLKTTKNAEPIFLPDIDFHCEEYHSICDFTFMRTTDARGIKRIIWMIYDNSVHYKEMIKPGSKLLKATARLMNITLL